MGQKLPDKNSNQDSENIKPYKLGIIVSKFPTLSETFIQRELVALENSGIEFIVYSLKRTTISHSLESIDLPLERIVYSKLLSLDTIMATLRCCLFHPIAVCTTIVRLIQNSYDKPIELMKALAILPITFHYGQLAKEAGVTHLHGHWANVPTTACWILQQTGKFEWSAAIHGEDIFSKNKLLSYKLNYAKFIVVCSKYFQNHLKYELSLVNPNKIHLVYHGLNKQTKCCSQTSLSKNVTERAKRLHNREVRIISVGRLVPTKGFDVLLRALHVLIFEMNYKPQLTIVGGGPLKDELKKMSVSLSVADNVIFAGAVRNSDVASYLAESDVFCLMPRFIPGHPPDGIPNAIIEAMSAQLPVVSSNVGAIPEIIENGVTGFMVKENDPESLASAISTMVQDFTLLQSMGKAGAGRVKQKFDQEKNISKLISILDQYL